MSMYQSTKVIELGSCAFRQWKAEHSHCKYIHGYQLKAKIWFGGKELDDKNWMVDFGGLKELKKKLQDQFDHTTVVAADDPKLDVFKELDKQGIIQLRVMPDGVGIERTAEYVWKTANDHVKELTDGRCWCVKVEVFEHEENSATYSGTSEKAKEVIDSQDADIISKLGSVSEEVKATFSDNLETKNVQGGRPAPVGNAGNKSLKEIFET